MNCKRNVLLAMLLLAVCLVLTACGSDGNTASQEKADFLYVLNSTGEFARIVRYQGESAEVVIPDSLGGKPVKEIGEFTFDSAPHVTSISIPTSVTKIEDASFRKLPQLQSISVAEDNIGFTVVDGVLYHKKMGTVYCYPQGKTGDTYVMPETVKTINGYAFYNTQLTEVTMSPIVTKVLANAFADSAKLMTVHFSPKLSQLYEGAFENCAALKDIELPASLTSIGTNCFKGCSSLTSMSIPETVSTIGGGAFAYCTSLEDCDVKGKQIQRVAASTFEGDTNLKAVSFGTDLMGIAEYAFKDCSSLTSFKLTDNLAALGQEAFAGCSMLSDITLPATVAQVGARAFDGTAYLNSMEGDFAIAGNGILLAYRGAEKDVTVPSDVLNVSWLNADVERVTIPEGVVSLSACAFENCGGLKEIILPASIKSIDSNCFRNCTGLTSFHIPANLETMGEGCFAGCTNMEKYTVDPTNITFTSDQGVLYNKISKWLLWYPSNSSMTSYTMSYGPIQIGPGAVQNAKNLESFDASAAEEVTKLSDYAFADCPKLKSVKLTNSFLAFGAHVFDNCTALSDFDILYTTTEIGAYCFRNCTALKTLTLDSPISKIGEGAFEGMDCSFKVSPDSYADSYVKAFGLKSAK